MASKRQNPLRKPQDFEKIGPTDIDGVEVCRAVKGEFFGESELVEASGERRGSASVCTRL